ncbi:MAG: ABC transporter substrate-binding protein [Candidatus Moraniibacteriota bacterium]
MLQALSLRDRIIIVTLTVFAAGALVFWLSAVYLSLTKAVPTSGGQYIEGVVAQPRYINPILSQTSDADADLVELIYESLFDYDQSGKLIKRMAADYSVSEDGKLYTVFLKPGILFHDGEELTAEDIVFTIRAIQDPAYKSPLRANWLGVEVGAPDRNTVTFSLKKPYFGFLENLTVGILPKHVWENIAPDRFTLADYNLIQPIGSGPYMFSSIDKDAQGNILSYHLKSWERYFGNTPFISKIALRFYADEEGLIDAFNRDEVSGIHSVSPQNVGNVSSKKQPHIYGLALPRVFAVFLNTNKSPALAYDEVREALSLSTDREAIIQSVLAGQGVPATGPFLPFMFGYEPSANGMNLDVARANTLLDEKGWKRGEEGLRVKNGTLLSFELVTPDWPELTMTADLLREQWKVIGASVEVKVLSQADLQQNVVRPREYQSLLFGEGAMLDPDPYSFWHSSQKNDPGLNLAFFEDKRVDEILLDAREMLDPEKRASLYREFQTIIAREYPAVFLYSPTYLYVVGNEVQGITQESINTPANRLADVTSWYINTKRVRK